MTFALSLMEEMAPRMAASTSVTTVPQETGFRVDDLIIDVGRQRVTRDRREIPLSQLSFELLLALARAAPNLVTFDQLIERAWGGGVVSPETVSQRVKLVRDALDDDPHSPRYIAGVRGRGYRMLAGVTPLPAEPPPQASVPAAPTQEPRSQAVFPQPISSRALRWHPLVLAAGIVLLCGAVWATAYSLAHPGWLTRLASGAGAQTTVIVEQPKTIAVLPLVDISPGGRDQYLADGLAQELSSRLARIPGIRVASQTSANAFKGRPGDVREIAHALGVRHVLEGSVRREGDHLRVTAQLIDANSGYRIWSQTYDRDWKDLLAIEDDLSRSIIRMLQVVLSSDVAGHINQPPTAQLKAFELYLSGLAKLQQPTEASELDAAEAMFQGSLTIDPRFALGYAGLCECYAVRYERDRDAAFAAKAEKACNQALALDGSLREVEVALARLYLVGGRNEQAATIYRGVVARSPADADAYIGLAESYAGLRRLPEAESAYRRAIDAEPDYWSAETAYANFLFEQGRSAAAVVHYRRVTELSPGSAAAFSNLGAALEMTGDLLGAAHAFEKSLELEPTRSAYSNSGTVYYFLGRFAAAADMFRKASGLASADHRVWGNLADALYQIPADRLEASREYRHAIALAESGLAVNPQDALTWIQLAYYYSRVGDTERAKRYTARALQLGPEVGYVHYYSALIAIQHQDTAAALDALRRAVELGYPAQLVRAAPEFADLRGDERLEHLLGKARAPAG